MKRMKDTTASDQLMGMLALKAGSTTVLRNRESSIIEFKESFNLGSLGKYARTMMAFANSKGGFLVFGVKPKPHSLGGVNLERFEGVDSAQITRALNQWASPELTWEMGIIVLNGMPLGYIFQHEAVRKPVICTQNKDDDLREGMIYYRYNAQSTFIRFPELRQIIDESIRREREALLKHLKLINEVGATNVQVLDTIKGRLVGARDTFLVDEKLLREITFIEKGQFSETHGAPTLRLIGEIKPIGGVVAEKRVPVGIHFDDILSAFLGQRDLGVEDAKAYLEETTFQPSPFTPINFFIRKAKLSLDEAEQLIRQTDSTVKTTKERLIKRIHNQERVAPQGAIATSGIPQITKEADLLTKSLTAMQTSKDRRSLLLKALREDPSIIDHSRMNGLLIPLFEAITHLTAFELKKHSVRLFDLLISIFTAFFSQMSSSERTVFRKAVSRVDELLFGNQK